MESTKHIQTRKTENIIVTLDPELLYRKYLVSDLNREWEEPFLDEDTGEVLAVKRHERILERGTYLEEDQIAVINFHIQAGDIKDGIEVSDQRRLGTMSLGWGLQPWSVRVRISKKSIKIILLARNVLQALEIARDYLELKYKDVFAIMSISGYKEHIFLYDDTQDLAVKDGQEDRHEEKPDEDDETKDVSVFYSIEAKVSLGEKNCQYFNFLVYAKNVEDAKSIVEKWIDEQIEAKKLGMVDEYIAKSEIVVNIISASIVNCTDVIGREFSLTYVRGENGGAEPEDAPEAGPEGTEEEPIDIFENE